MAPRKPNGQFQKGVSGNPTGKSPRPIYLPDGTKITQTQLFQRNIAEVHQVLVDIVLSPSSKDRDKIVAGKILMDRAFGTPKQQIEVNNTGDASAHAINLKQETTEALRELVNRIHNSQDVINADFAEDEDAE